MPGLNGKAVSITSHISVLMILVTMAVAEKFLIGKH
jgi:hypothetical protein